MSEGEGVANVTVTNLCVYTHLLVDVGRRKVLPAIAINPADTRRDPREERFGPQAKGTRRDYGQQWQQQHHRTTVCIKQGRDDEQGGGGVFG